VDLELRYPAGGFRLKDLVVRCLAFDRREQGPNSSLSYVVATTPHGDAALTPDERTPRVRVTKLVRGIMGEGGWLFLPYCVFGDDVVRCADGAKLPRRAPHDRRGTGWIGRATAGDAVGFIVGREDDAVVVRPAFHAWSTGGTCAIFVADDLGGLRRPLTTFVAGFAQGS